ncbi:hypothetical protein BU24DRAFT_489611 [Aaosphaeria arxii CBS 175.79]|uniref:Uncharacterized protein n=1 Tax=Aaosphaeria arxii CBS 175.79 TaxID=1450172 RepID=A0A6A5Y592_9PLEO|nr:uncharacterized protein BU24DRAFT_489611 [Aaosphaeria arxii CBS 175.79]KAF2019704.1 hypothetical protein BU24DRAFT_489611 [Aaosphaeria arxii CBS 175.79]
MFAVEDEVDWSDGSICLTPGPVACYSSQVGFAAPSGTGRSTPTFGVQSPTFDTSVELPEEFSDRFWDDQQPSSDGGLSAGDNFQTGDAFDDIHDDTVTCSSPRSTRSDDPYWAVNLTDSSRRVSNTSSNTEYSVAAPKRYQEHWRKRLINDHKARLAIRQHEDVEAIIKRAIAAGIVKSYRRIDKIHVNFERPHVVPDPVFQDEEAGYFNGYAAVQTPDPGSLEELPSLRQPLLKRKRKAHTQRSSAGALTKRPKKRLRTAADYRRYNKTIARDESLPLHPSGSKTLDPHQILPESAYFEPLDSVEKPAWRCGIKHALGYYYNAGDRKACPGCNTNIAKNQSAKEMDFYLPSGMYSYQDSPPTTGTKWKPSRPTGKKLKHAPQSHNGIAKLHYWKALQSGSSDHEALQIAKDAVLERLKPKLKPKSKPNPKPIPTVPDFEPTPEPTPDMGPHPSGSKTMEHGQGIPACHYFEKSDRHEEYAWRCDVAHALGRYYLAGDKRSCPGCGTCKSSQAKRQEMDFYMPPGSVVRQEAQGITSWKPRKKNIAQPRNVNEHALTHNQLCTKFYGEHIERGEAHGDALRLAIQDIDAYLDAKFSQHQFTSEVTDTNASTSNVAGEQDSDMVDVGYQSTHSMTTEEPSRFETQHADSSDESYCAPASSTFTIKTAQDVTDILTCSEFIGNIVVAADGPEVIALDGITTISGNLDIENVAELRSLTSNTLQTVQSFTLNDLPQLSSLSFASLSNFSSLKWYNLPLLKSVIIAPSGVSQEIDDVTIFNTALTDLDWINWPLGSQLNISNNYALETFSIPYSKINTGSAITLSNNSKMANLDLSQVNGIYGGLAISGDNVLTGVRFDSLETIGGFVQMNGDFSNISMPALKYINGALSVRSTSDIASFCNDLQQLESQGHYDCTANANKGSTTNPTVVTTQTIIPETSPQATEVVKPEPPTLSKGGKIGIAVALVIVFFILLVAGSFYLRHRIRSKVQEIEQKPKDHDEEVADVSRRNQSSASLANELETPIARLEIAPGKERHELESPAVQVEIGQGTQRHELDGGIPEKGMGRFDSGEWKTPSTPISPAETWGTASNKSDTHLIRYELP